MELARRRSSTRADSSPASAKACRIRSAPPGTAWASISRCSPRTPPRSSCACSTSTASARSERIELPEYTDEVWHGYLPDARPGTSTATACTAPTSPRRAIASIRTSCCSTPMRKRPSWRARVGPGALRLHHRPPGDDLTFDERDSAPFMPKCRVVDPAFTGARPAAPRAVGAHHLLRGPRAGFTKRHPAGARGTARHLRGARRPGGHRLYQGPRRDRGRAAADPHLRRRQLPARQGPHQLLGLQHHRLLRPRSALLRRRANAAPSSRRWWRACTTPGSR